MIFDDFRGKRINSLKLAKNAKQNLARISKGD